VYAGPCDAGLLSPSAWTPITDPLVLQGYIATTCFPAQVTFTFRALTPP
jgi:hypothetical protein